MDNEFEKDKTGMPDENSEIKKPDDIPEAEAAESLDEVKEAEADAVNDEAAETVAETDVNSEAASPEETGLNIEGDKKGFFQRWKEKELAKEAARLERYEKSEENMKKIREQRRAEMFADGKEPNALQRFLMSEGKYINYENKHSIILGFTAILGIILFVLIFRAGFITKEKFGLGKEATKAIVYSKDNELYCYDLKNEPVLISDNLSSGGSATYSYVGNGTTVAEDGKSVYFIDNVAANGSFSLNFYKAGSSSEPSLIGDNVADYDISYKGEGAVYIVPDESGKTGILYGYSRKDNKSYEIAQNVVIGGTDYSISSDGSKVIYASGDNNSIALNICSIDGSNAKTIDNDVAQYLVTTRDSYLYYIKAVGADDGTSSYSIYSYDINKGTSKLIDENVIAVTLSSKENAVIYYKYNGNMIKATDVVNDDGDDSEAAKALRTEIADYEFKDIACAVYRYENGETKLINDKVFTAMPMDKEGKYIAYTVPQKLDEIKVNLSEISSVNEISALYYMQAMQADCDTYIYELNGFNDYVLFENSYLYSFANSGSNAQFACFVNYDESAQTGKLVLSTFYDKGIKAYSELEDDVESFQFMGDGSRLVYLRGIGADGAGTLNYIESNVSDEISDSAYYYEATTDQYRRVFYLDNYNAETYGGTFHFYQQAADTVVDDNVYMFAYRNNNNALYMKNYDMTTGTGDLYYLNGKNSVLVDENVSSVFDFYKVG